MIPKKHRIDSETLKKVIKTGKNTSSAHFFAKKLSNNTPRSRFSIVISKKTSKLSVRRHQIKRQISDIIEKKAFITKVPADIVIFSKDNACDVPFIEIKKEIDALIFN